MTDDKPDSSGKKLEVEESSGIDIDVRKILRIIRSDKMGLAGLLILFLLVSIAVMAPALAPYDPAEEDYGSSYQSPSSEHLLGTDNVGRDILSQLIHGTRPAFFVGITSALFISVIGTAVGVVSGYYGGLADDVLMRLVDFTYGLPLLPFMIVLVALWEPSLLTIVLAISTLLWRTVARVTRSQVLSIKEKPYIKSAEISGASDVRVMGKHIVPNVLPLTFLYGSFGIAWAILAEANLSFLGFGDPELITWGKMLLLAMQSQALLRDAWWWFVAPGLMIMLTVGSAFAIGRGYEEVINPELRESR
jgi:peptide/nickel transport system permease protein